MKSQDWLERLRESSKYLYSSYPPNRETVQLVGPKPISFRASKSDKELIIKAIEIQVKEIPWICTEDIAIRIEWMINDRERYESPHTPDADNIIKPILDALCGPEGIIVDDCQVVSLNVSCLGGWVHGKNNFELHVKLPNSGIYKNYACIPKNTIQMVHLGKHLYFPINKELSSELALVNHYIDWVANMPEDHSEEGDMLLRRFFHKTRVIGKYDLISPEEYFRNHT